MDEQNIYQQIVNGIAEAVNGAAGEGYDDPLMEDIVLDDERTIRVLLADLPKDRLAELVAEIHSRIGQWRVNPFEVVEYMGKRTMRFILRPESEIRKLYNWMR